MTAAFPTQTSGLVVGRVVCASNNPMKTQKTQKKTNQPPIDGAAPETETGRLTSVQRRAR